MDDRLWVKDERIRLLEAERDALREALEWISQRDPSRRAQDLRLKAVAALERPE
jgi:hypothetical protein